MATSKKEPVFCYDCRKEVTGYFHSWIDVPDKEGLCSQCHDKRAQMLYQWIKDHPVDPALDARAKIWSIYNRTLAQAKKDLEERLEKLEYKEVQG